MVYGSRFRGDPGYKVPLGRRAGNMIFSVVLSTLTRQRITDPTSGFRMTNRRGIELFARDYPHDYPEVEALLMLHAHHLRIHEVHVRMNARGFGAQLDRLPAQRLLHGQGAAGAVRRPLPPPPDPGRGDRRGRARRRPAGGGPERARCGWRALRRWPPSSRSARRPRAADDARGRPPRPTSGPGSLGADDPRGRARRHDRDPGRHVPADQRRDPDRAGQHDLAAPASSETTIVPTRRRRRARPDRTYSRRRVAPAEQPERRRRLADRDQGADHRPDRDPGDLPPGPRAGPPPAAGRALRAAVDVGRGGRCSCSRSGPTGST